MDWQLLVLGLLKLRDMHGYQLGDLIDKRLKYLTDLKKPTLYNILAKLETEGLVTKTASREGNRPERFTYHLSNQGEARFQNLLRANLRETHPVYFNDDMGLLFLSELPVPQAELYLNEKATALDRQIAEMTHALERHAQGTPASFTLRHHVIHLEAERTWLEELRGQLQDQPVSSDILACLEAAETRSSVGK
jgi:DNA-binding PadR family transcriptional regulator